MFFPTKVSLLLAKLPLDCCIVVVVDAACCNERVGEEFLAQGGEDLNDTTDVAAIVLSLLFFVSTSSMLPGPLINEPRCSFELYTISLEVAELKRIVEVVMVAVMLVLPSPLMFPLDGDVLRLLAAVSMAASSRYLVFSSGMTDMASSVPRLPPTPPGPPPPQTMLRNGAILTNSFWNDSLYHPYKKGL